VDAKEDKNMAVMRDWPMLLSTTKLRSLLGLEGYYKKFVLKLAHWTTRLFTLTTKNVHSGGWGIMRQNLTIFRGL
jgi:hypothetical protein